MDVDAAAWKASHRPSLAWGTDGQLHIAYERETTSSEILKIRHRSWDGVSWSAVTGLGTNASFSRAPAIASGPNSTLHVVWQDGENVGSDIFYAAFDGSVWGATEQIVTGPSDVASPSVAVASNGDVYVSWEDCRYAETELHLKSTHEGSWGDEIRLTSAPGPSKLAGLAAGTSRVCVVWTDLRDGNPEIYFRETLTGATAVVLGPPVSEGLGAVHLSALRPMPFTTETRFEMHLAARTRVSLDVFDLAGRRVRTLASGAHSEGIHVFRWEGRNGAGHRVAPGVYFIRCATPLGRDVQRAVVLR
jgi:hypothetical protein